MTDTLIVIPVRMDSKRFPGKPLINIFGKAMVYHVWHMAKKSRVGDVLVACCDKEVKDYLLEKKIPHIMTKKNHRSGTDRVYEAMKKFSKIKKYNYIINLQGDLPNISPKHISKLAKIIQVKNSMMATLVTKIKIKNKISDRNIVKVALTKNIKKLKAVYFSRNPIPFKANEYYEHVGIYAYNKIILKKFVSFKEGYLERLESLEQLRALENGFDINLAEINDAPISIDTPKDLKTFIEQKDKIK